MIFQRLRCRPKDLEIERGASSIGKLRSRARRHPIGKSHPGEDHELTAMGERSCHSSAKAREVRYTFFCAAFHGASTGRTASS